MRKELGYRLAAVYGGDGSLDKGAAAMARSMVAVNDISVTDIQIINPVSASFEQHGVSKAVEDRHGTSRTVNAIPNTHLRFAPDSIKSDGLNVKDANLLKIEVTYGYQLRMPYLDMKIPGVPWIMRNLMIHADQENWMFYVRGLLPIKSTATVRMQSDAWDFQEQPPVVRAFESAYEWIYEQIEGEPLSGEPNNLVDCTGTETNTTTSSTTVNEFGLTVQQGNMSPTQTGEENQFCEVPDDPEQPGGDQNSSC